MADTTGKKEAPQKIVKDSNALLRESEQLGSQLDETLKKILGVEEWQRQQAAAEAARRRKAAEDAARKEALRKSLEGASSARTEREPVVKREPSRQERKRTLADLGPRMRDGAGNPISDRNNAYECYQNGVRRISDGTIMMWVADDYPGGVLITFKDPRRKSKKSKA
ncbi:MAG: hypothetical protein AAB573_05165 [Patescibacteria group bacterium]